MPRLTAVTTPDWDADFISRSPIFEPLRAAAAMLPLSHWPGYEDLNHVLASRVPAVVTASGRALRFVAQSARQQAFEDKFEPRTFLRGEVQFRDRSWHDLFNALVWLTFPLAKAALNERHFAELKKQQERGARNRGPSQDALSIFDEGGIIAASSDPSLADMLVAHEWKALFWQRRAAVVDNLQFHVFGHALYEKALAPFSGVTGRSVILAVEPTFHGAPLAVRLAELDSRVAAWISDSTRLLSPREMHPVPALGVPGWHADNAHAAYYDDTRYFRPLTAID